MAGAGWHDFIPGEVLTAANVQDYLQDQAVMKFTSAAARTSALPAPSQGMMSFLNDTGAVETYYAAWNATTNPGGKTPAGWYPARSQGVVPMIPSTVAIPSGGSATANSLGQITFASAASVSLNGVFSTSYNKYLIYLTGVSASANADIYFRLRTAAWTDAATAYYQQHVNISAGTLSGVSDANVAQGVIGISGTGAGFASSAFVMHNPATAVATSYTGQLYGVVATQLGKSIHGYHATAAAYTGLSLIPSTGTFSGTVQILGINE